MKHRIDTYRDAEKTMKDKTLRQAMYDPALFFMKDTVVNLHGDAHVRKRQALNSLFTREFFRDYQNRVLPAALDQVLKPVVAEGRGDVAILAFQALVNLTSDVTGIDRVGTEEETNRILKIIRGLAHVSTVEQLLSGSVDDANRKIREALVEFERDFYVPSARRRQALIDQGAELPKDVMTVMLVNYPNGELPHDVMVKDAALFLLASAATQANTLCFIMLDILTWCRDHPGTRETLLVEPATLQKFIWEAIRLHPPQVVSLRRASCPMHVPDGGEVAAGDVIEFDMATANRNPDIFGPDADTFNPYRVPPGRIAAPGLSFGAGPHACVGRVLAAGVPITAENADNEDTEFGTLHMITHALLELGVDLDRDHPPIVDEATVRRHIVSLPFVLRPELAAAAGREVAGGGCPFTRS
ncbi:cytochrome P450-like protein [Burkholderia lata]|uniref:cytochrome P450 n=1 Tax=Burkholderia lata (strain ATCC 17760 / DSM 23089 / LMG 22485 / NCIMB 9086 / R18194 / 383) TaxID=482957 RepID=UPI0014533FB9|nr:cytochrome P450 [Burkholderia lata]VWB08322.1 cytochrome P450-like protein [Burkholderia lata]